MQKPSYHKLLRVKSNPVWFLPRYRWLCFIKFGMNDHLGSESKNIRAIFEIPSWAELRGFLMIFLEAKKVEERPCILAWERNFKNRFYGFLPTTMTVIYAKFGAINWNIYGKKSYRVRFSPFISYDRRLPVHTTLTPISYLLK